MLVDVPKQWKIIIKVKTVVHLIHFILIGLDARNCVLHIFWWKGVLTLFDDFQHGA